MAAAQIVICTGEEEGHDSTHMQGNPICQTHNVTFNAARGCDLCRWGTD